MRVDGEFLAVDGKSNFDGTFTAVTQHDGKFLAVDGFPFFDGNFLAVDGNSNFDGKSPLHRDRPSVRYFYVGKITEHLPGKFGASRRGHERDAAVQEGFVPRSFRPRVYVMYSRRGGRGRRSNGVPCPG